MKVTLAILLALVAGACGSSPTTPSSTPPPTSTAPPRWTLTGSVTASIGGPINGAVVSILDGPDVGKTATTDTTGRFTLANLTQAGFTARATAGGYVGASQSVTLTADAVVNFQLPRVPIAVLSFEGSLQWIVRPDGGADGRGTGVNTGDACATAISGLVTFTNTQPPNPLDIPWSLPPTRIVRPGERFEYNLSAGLDQVPLLRAEGTYRTRFAFTSIDCQ
jgi:hypothetical protein